eukprot:9635041-Karenia_brevis.AAC.1
MHWRVWSSTHAVISKHFQISPNVVLLECLAHALAHVAPDGYAPGVVDVVNEMHGPLLTKTPVGSPHGSSQWATL